MIDVDLCKQDTRKNNKEWSLDNFKEQESVKSSSHVIRKFINSAIYVEKPLSATVSSENTSISQIYSNESLLDINSAKTKRCTCSLDQKVCPCHSSETSIPMESKKDIAVTVSKVTESKTKISHASPSSNNTEKEMVIKNWIIKKETEKKKKDNKEKMLQETKLKEKEAILEQERNNFKRWLTNKKKTEIEAKKKKQKELEEQELKELEKEKRQLENQLNFQLWLKKKQEVELEKKIKQQMHFIDELEKKEKQLKENDKAFIEWLENSKTKQKPVPMNRGLQTLCSSSSVTYINPNPWNPAP